VLSFVKSTSQQSPSLGIPGNTGEGRGRLQTFTARGASGPCRQEEEIVTSDQHVPGPCLQETFASLARPLEPHPGITWSGGEAEAKATYAQQRGLGRLCCLLSECHAQVTQWPVDPKSSVAWELRLAGKAGSTQSWCAQVTRGPLPSVPGLPRTQRKDTSPNRDRATSLKFHPARLARLP
jgi:hypothetical protein